MPIFTKSLPLSLYIHLPWCVRKCPYCDFNSHEMKDLLPEKEYVVTLLQQLDTHLSQIQDRNLVSIFFGGGTPSLFSGDSIAKILHGIRERIPHDSNLEITLEANPGTIDQVRFLEFYQAGVNRLSLGVQSFQDEKLKLLGRIHNVENVYEAINVAKKVGFANFNVDLMYGLPQQTLDDAIFDLTMAVKCEASHLSWYQLTIEPNTYFHHNTPELPSEETIWAMQQAGQEFIKKSGFNQYEVSAYSLPEKNCKHNRNYWEFGDYLGIGAGAYSKMTDCEKGLIQRFSQPKHPREYLKQTKNSTENLQVLSQEDLIFEFMLNALRLTEGFPISLFTERTGLSADLLNPFVAAAEKRNLMHKNDSHFLPTALGKRFLNDLVAIFLPL